MTNQPFLILVAGPYRSGTNDDPVPACVSAALLREQMKWWRSRKRMGEKFIPVLKMCLVCKRKLREHTH